MAVNHACPECGESVAEDAKYCSECGVDLGTLTCPNCHVQLNEDPNFCSECGYEIRSATEDSTGGDRVDDGSEGTVENIAKEGKSIQTKDSVDNGWNPAYPVFSVFMALMLVWAGIVQPPGDIVGIVLIVAGVLVIPRVRRHIVPLVHEKMGVDLAWNRDDWEDGPPDNLWRRPFFLVGIAYSLLLLLAIAVSVMEAANDPTMSAGTGLMMTVFVFILAVFFVYGIRGFRRLTPGR